MKQKLLTIFLVVIMVVTTLPLGVIPGINSGGVQAATTFQNAVSSIAENEGQFSCIGTSLNSIVVSRRVNKIYPSMDCMDCNGVYYYDSTIFDTFHIEPYDFDISSKYSTFSGTIFVPPAETSGKETNVKILADDELIFEVTLTGDSQPVDFCLSLEGVDKLSIDPTIHYDWGYVVFANTVLSEVKYDTTGKMAADIYSPSTQVARQLFKVFNNRCTYEEAEEFCKLLQGHLATFETSAEKKAIEELMDEKCVEESMYYIESYRDSNYIVTSSDYLAYRVDDELSFDDSCYEDISADRVCGFICEWDECDPNNIEKWYNHANLNDLGGINFSREQAENSFGDVYYDCTAFRAGFYDKGTYYLGGKYNVFSAVLFVSKELKAFDKSRIEIYGDNKLIYSNYLLYKDTPNIELELDVTGIKILRIETGTAYTSILILADTDVYWRDEVENQVVILGDFELSKDTWSFANHKLSFLDYPDGDVSKNTIARLKYYIPEERYRQVYGDRYVQMAHAAETDDSKDTSYKSMIPSTWNGNCAGMAASVLLFNTGKLSYDGDLISYYDAIRYESDIFGTSIYATSGYDTPMTRLIESLQISRFYDNYVTSDDYCSEEKIDDVSANIIHESDGDFVDKFYNYVKNSNSPVLVAIYFSEYETISDFDGHALLVYGYETKADDDGWIKLYVYDCNYPYPSDDLLGVGYDCANFYTTNPRYMEINVDKNLWRYNGSINASTPSRYVGCDANGDLITHTLKVNKVVKYNFPDFFLYFDCSVIPSSFDGTRISRFYSDEGYSHLMLSANTNLNIYSNNDELLACCENGYGLSLSDEVEFIPYISEGNNEDDYVKGYFSINSNSYRIEYVDGDDITIVDSDGVINLEFSGEASIEVNTIDNCVEVLSESDNDMSVQIANDDGEELTALYIEGIMVEGDILECSVNELGEMDANLTTENDSTELDVYLYNENSEGSEYVETLCLTMAESNHDVDAFLNGEEVVEEPTPSVTTTPSISPTVAPTTSPVTTPEGGTGSGSTPTSAPTGSGSTPTTAPTAAPTSAPTAAPELNVGDFINRCYSVALGRSADEAGYNYWVDNLNNGQACGAQVGYGFIFSQEYINKNRSDKEFVTDMYAMYFGREADSDGFIYWVDLLESGLTREDIMAGFANSEEFYNLCNKYGVVCGTYLVGVPNDVQGGVNCFVARMYKVCLNRLPDMGGQAGWVLKLMNGEVSGTTCAYGFVFSPEFIGKNPSNEAFVNYMYAAFFGREADEAGFNAWVDVLNGGGSYEDVFAGFSGSVEFANLCASYGIQA